MTKKELILRAGGWEQLMLGSDLHPKVTFGMFRQGLYRYPETLEQVVRWTLDWANTKPKRTMLGFRRKE